MSIAAALDELLTAPTVKSCGVGAWISNQSDETRKKITLCIDAGISRANIHASLAANGFRLGLSAFNNHLSGRCGCTQLPDGDNL